MPYDSRTLLRVIDGLDRPHAFLLDLFFPELVLFDTKKVEFDKLDRAEGLAPFVSPRVAGKTLKGRGFKTESFEPAYLKPKDEVDIDRPMRRRPGESLAFDMSPAERKDAIIAEILADQEKAIIRRKEWMAAQILQTGKVVVTGEDYPEKEVDYGRAAALTIALIGAARWGEAGILPQDDLEDWFALVSSNSGATVDTVICDPVAWRYLRKDPDFRAALDNRRQMGGEMQFGPTVAGGEGMRGRYVGSIDGVDYFTYQQPFTDDAGAPAKMLADGSVIFGSRGQVEGYQAHGAIKDAQAGYAAFEFWPKNWVDDDPALEFVMTQSAPLVVPARVNAVGYAKVT